MTDEPKISDAEVKAFGDAAAVCSCVGCARHIKHALAAFLAARVPEQKRGYAGAFENGEIAGFNACRDIVLNGRAEGK